MNRNEGKILPERPSGIQSRIPPAAVLVLLAGESLVFEVRSRALRTQPGEICLPGGRMEAGETPTACALRETGEELGLSRDAVEVLGSLDALSHVNGQMVYPILARTSPERLRQLRPNADEVEEVFTVPLDWLAAHPPADYSYRLRPVDPVNVPEQILRWMEGYPNLRRGRYWDYQGRLIWGLTARIVAQVVERFHPPAAP